MYRLVLFKAISLKWRMEVWIDRILQQFSSNSPRKKNYVENFSYISEKLYAKLKYSLFLYNGPNPDIKNAFEKLERDLFNGKAFRRTFTLLRVAVNNALHSPLEYGTRSFTIIYRLDNVNWIFLYLDVRRPRRNSGKFKTATRESRREMLIVRPIYLYRTKNMLIKLLFRREQFWNSFCDVI